MFVVAEAARDELAVRGAARWMNRFEPQTPPRGPHDSKPTVAPALGLQP